MPTDTKGTVAASLKFRGKFYRAPVEARIGCVCAEQKRRSAGENKIRIKIKGDKIDLAIAIDRRSS